jgi:hypothetical protein
MHTVLIAATAAPAGHSVSGVTVFILLILAAAGFGVVYKASVRRHPYRPCRACGESSKGRGTFFTNSFGPCGRCGGKGRELRLFAREPGSRN